MSITQTSCSSKQLTNSSLSLSDNNSQAVPKLGPGNLVPHWWYSKILSCGKPDFVAITLLSELLFLHRRDEGREYAEGYGHFERKFNLTRWQLQMATQRLHEAGIVLRSFRTVVVAGRNFPNELHLKLNLEALLALKPADVSVGGNSSGNSGGGVSAAADFSSSTDEGEIFCDQVFGDSDVTSLEIPELHNNKDIYKKSRSNSSNFCKRVFGSLNFSRGRALSEFHPLSLEDVRSLQNTSGRDFDTNFCNQLLLRLAGKYPSYKFPTKSAFLSYMTKLLANEMRDAVRVSNGSFRFRDSLDAQGLNEDRKEKFLEYIERSTDTSYQAQLKRKIAGVFGVNLAYELLSNTNFHLSGDNDSEITFNSNNSLSLSDNQKAQLLEQVRAVYGDSVSSLNIDCKNSVPSPLSAEARGRVADLTDDVELQDNSLWGMVRASLRRACGEHIDRHWFSKLIPIVDDAEKTLTLKAPSNFIRDWIKTNYAELIEKVCMPSGVKFGEVVI